MSESIKEITGFNITRLRKRAGLTQRAVGDALKTTGKTVYLWEKGVTWPESEKFDQMAALFKVPVTEFFVPLEARSDDLPPTLEASLAIILEKLGFDPTALRKKS